MAVGAARGRRRAPRRVPRRTPRGGARWATTEQCTSRWPSSPPCPVGGWTTWSSASTRRQAADLRDADGRRRGVPGPVAGASDLGRARSSTTRAAPRLAAGDRRPRRRVEGRDRGRRPRFRPHLTVARVGRPAEVSRGSGCSTATRDRRGRSTREDPAWPRSSARARAAGRATRGSSRFGRTWATPRRA